MPRGKTGGGQTSQMLSISDPVIGHQYKNLPYKRHSDDEPRLIHMPADFSIDCVQEAPDDVASYWPIGEIATFHDESYPNWVTLSKRNKIDIDDTDVAADKERQYFEVLTRATMSWAMLEAIRVSMDTSRVCSEVAQTAIARRFRKLEFAGNRIAEYPNYELLRSNALHWCQLVAEKPNGPLYGMGYWNPSDISTAADYDVTDLTAVDAVIDRIHTLLDSLDADSDWVKVRIALESLPVGGTTAPLSVPAATIDPARVDVYLQSALRKDDPDVAERTAQYPNIEEDGAEKVPVYVRYDRGGLLAPDPYLLTLLRPHVIFEHDNRGDDAGSYGAYANVTDATINDQRNNIASYYKLNGDHVTEEFKYNEDAADPVGLTKVFPHFIHGARTLQDSSQNVDKMSGSFTNYVKFDVPLTHFGETTLTLFERAAQRTTSFKA
uniref:Uncharacterized protein n=1 Tax=viral metagenome TaxID=1070528 RepID=A0A2V0R9Y5_9ZZZZ